jgi:NADP-dependent 3-hydroxy acid dehydrogenase YdfG
MRKIVFITGATAGFGEAFAQVFASNHYDCIITGRRSERLEKLKQQLESSYNISCFTLCFDVRKETDVQHAVESLPESWKQVDVLINNAGLALGRELFDEASTDDWNTMIDTNVKGLLYVSKAVLPFMISRNKGHIINIGSIAGKEVYERGNVYCASKAAVDAITRGMRIDLLPHHIKVTAIHPGAAETEFSMVRFKGAEATAKKMYEGFTPLEAKDVAAIVFFTANLPAHVCINDLVLTCTQQANAYLINRSGILKDEVN